MRNRAGATEIQHEVSLLTDDDLYLFNEGSHYRLYEKLGAHLISSNGVAGAHFAVWAPNAERVFVMGDFNGWNNGSHALRPKGQSGIDLVGNDFINFGCHGGTLLILNVDKGLVGQGVSLPRSDS